MLPNSGPVRTCRPPMPTASNRIFVLHDPGADIEIVDVLLDVEVARQPGEVVPVAHLPFHVGPVGLAWLNPDAVRDSRWPARSGFRRSRRRGCAG